MAQRSGPVTAKGSQVLDMAVETEIPEVEDIEESGEMAADSV